jgi:hypothetical protein
MLKKYAEVKCIQSWKKVASLTSLYYSLDTILSFTTDYAFANKKLYIYLY